jgi:hypothetical protein
MQRPDVVQGDVQHIFDWVYLLAFVATVAM